VICKQRVELSLEGFLFLAEDVWVGHLCSFMPGCHRHLPNISSNKIAAQSDSLIAVDQLEYNLAI
jgi:hypothetical protein